MSHNKKSHPSKPFGGSVEFIPPQPAFMEFIDSHRIWGFRRLIHFVLEEKAIGRIQPRPGVGFVFPLNSAAREDTHWGVIASLVFEF
jgi:hypothetical protein